MKPVKEEGKISVIKFIDSNCMIGTRAYARECSVKTIDELFDVYDRCGIESGIVHHSIAAADDILEGNSVLMQEIKGVDRLLPQWVAVPSYTGVFAVDKLIAAMKKNGVKTLRIYPRSHNFSVAPYSGGELFQQLNELKIPVFIRCTEIAWEQLFELCNTYPCMPIVICDTGYWAQRQIFPILDKCRNLYVETSTYVMHDGIAETVNSFGAERLIFGSGLPEGSACGAATLIRYADITEKQKQMIARENILRLLEEADV